MTREEFFQRWGSVLRGGQKSAPTPEQDPLQAPVVAEGGRTTDDIRREAWARAFKRGE